MNNSRHIRLLIRIVTRVNWVRCIALVLCFVLVTTSLDMTAFAFTDDANAVNDVVINSLSNDEIAEEADDEQEFETEQVLLKQPESEQWAFEQSLTIDGVVITITADEGVFPEDTTIVVRKVTPSEENGVKKAIDEVRDDDKNVAISYTFDITAYDKEGNVIEPNSEYGFVKVTFKMAEIANKNLETEVYHVEETNDGLNAENLDVNTEEGEMDEATVETDGFSYYTVEFTYGNLQYVMEGDTQVTLKEILDYLGIVGEVKDAVFSSPELVDVSMNESGEWIVTALQPFSSDEKLIVTISGVDFEIEFDIQVTDYFYVTTFYAMLGNSVASVTHNSDVTNYETLADAIEAAIDGDTVCLLSDVNENVTINNNITLDLNGKVLEGTGSGSVITINNGAIVEFIDSAPTVPHYFTYKSNNAWDLTDESAGAIALDDFIRDNCEDNTTIIRVNGGCITGGNATSGGGVYINGQGSVTTLIMTDGNIVGNKGYHGSAVYVNGISGNANFVMKGNSKIAGCNADGNGSVYVVGTSGQAGFTMEGNSGIIGCLVNECGAGIFSINAYAMMKDSSRLVGNVSKNTLGYGGGVWTNKSFSMFSDAVISNCKADKGGGIWADAGSLIMDDNSRIENCTATIDGGGICACNCTNFSFLKNSKVIGCTAGNGGGGVYSYSCNFVMSGNSSINDNTANVSFQLKPISGGGVCIEGGTFKMYGGTISGNKSAQNGGGLNIYKSNSGITIGGTAKITGNTVSDKNNNLYLPDGKSVIIGTAESAPQSNMSVGVTVQTAPTKNNPVVISGANSADYSNNFISDDQKYSIVNDSNVIKLMSNVSVITTTPQAKASLKYNTYAQELVTEGEAEHGTMYYAIGDVTSTEIPDEAVWSTAISTKANAGTYRVWYQAKGDTNYADTTPEYVDVTIAKAQHKVTELKALNPTYNGNEQVLISAGSCTTGTIKYSLDGTNYSDLADSIKETEIGSYTVYYMVEGTENYETYGPKSITAKIVKKGQSKPKSGSQPSQEPSEPETQPAVPAITTITTIQYAETGIAVMNYVANNPIGNGMPLPYLTMDSEKTGWKKIDESLDAHKAKYINQAVAPLGITMNGYTTVDTTIIINAHEKQIPLSFAIDNDVAIGIPVANTVLSNQAKVGKKTYFNISSMTTKDAVSIKKAHAGLVPSDIVAIGGNENTPVVLTLCSNDIYSIDNAQLMTITFNAKKLGFKVGDKVYLYCGTSQIGIAMFKFGIVDENGFVTFAVPMVNNYWTIGSRNMGNMLLRYEKKRQNTNSGA